MKFRVFLLLPLILSAFTLGGCAKPEGANNGTDVAFVKKHCSELLNKKVRLTVVYEGWNCPPSCKHPGLSRSDSCVKDNTGCIYLASTGGLNPIGDKGKKFRIEAVVKRASNGVCYLKVLKVERVNKS
jgi:hypothetical protein